VICVVTMWCRFDSIFNFAHTSQNTQDVFVPAASAFSVAAESQRRGAGVMLFRPRPAGVAKQTLAKNLYKDPELFFERFFDSTRRDNAMWTREDGDIDVARLRRLLVAQRVLDY
jgi:hypothetical protein